MHYLNPADYLDGPEPYYFIEDDDGPLDGPDFATEHEAVQAAREESADFSDVYRVYKSSNGNDAQVVALVMSGVVYWPETPYGPDPAPEGLTRIPGRAWVD